MEIGVWLLIAFGLAPVLRRLPKRIVAVFLALCVLTLGWVAYEDYWFGRHLIHPLTIEQSAAFQAGALDRHASARTARPGF